MWYAGNCFSSVWKVKKRYKQLLKIYHPDNLCGDTETLQEINREYDRLLKQYETKKEEQSDI